MRVIIARHAETHQNEDNVLQGSGTGNGSALTEFGKRQSVELCNELLGEFDVKSIIVSPARRTRDTIEPMKHCASTFIEDENIREIDCGDWEGRSIARLEQECKNEWEIWKTHPLSFAFPGGESINDVFSRTDQFLKGLLKSNELSDVLLISHSATISTLIANILSVELSEAWNTRLGYHNNAEFSVFNFGNSTELLDYSLKNRNHLTST